MLYLFVGMIASGILGRVTLLSHRGGWFFEDQARKPSASHILELLGTIAGVAGFIVSFLLFDWWWPLIAAAFGYWIVGPIAVTRASYAFFYQTQLITSLISLFCSLALCNFYFEFF